MWTQDSPTPARWGGRMIRRLAREPAFADSWTLVRQRTSVPHWSFVICHLPFQCPFPQPRKNHRRYDQDVNQTAHHPADDRRCEWLHHFRALTMTAHDRQQTRDHPARSCRTPRTLACCPENQLCFRCSCASEFQAGFFQCAVSGWAAVAAAGGSWFSLRIARERQM